jgi:hypothetical protein
MRNDDLFHTPGILYRPANLKRITCLLGNSSDGVVYNNFNLDQLHIDYPDFSHLDYQKYLEDHFFLPPGGRPEHKFWNHLTQRTVPGRKKESVRLGLFNCFPIDLMSDEVEKSIKVGSQLGFINSSPLKIELEFSPVDKTINWLLCFTFMYTNKLTCSGNRFKQELNLQTLK